MNFESPTQLAPRPYLGDCPSRDTEGLIPGSEALRAQFPLLQQSVHGTRLAYLDNAATTAMPLDVINAMRDFETQHRANIHRGVHSLSQYATDDFVQARSALKQFIGADSTHELVFTSGTTESLNLVAQGMWVANPEGAWLRPGDEIIVSGLEHHANLLPWQRAARMSGAALRILLPDSCGRIHTASLQRLLSPRTRVFALTASANATGERPPYEALLDLAAQAGALTVLDAAQAAGHAMPSLTQINCDFLAFSGHKMHGPMGIGVLAGRRSALERLTPLRLGGDMVTQVRWDAAEYAELPARLEGGTPNVAGAVGLAEAVRFITRVGRRAIAEHVHKLRAQALEGLTCLPDVTVLSPHATQSALVSFVARHVHPHDIGTLLDDQGMAVRTGHHCAQPLMDHLGLGPSTRASFALYNTSEEVDRMVRGVALTLEKMR